MADFTIKEDATAPNIEARLKAKDGTTVTLTGASVVFSMWDKRTRTAKITRQAATIESATPPAAAGDPNVSYTWAVGDTDTPGIYEAEWEVTYGGGTVEVFPDRGYNIIEITEAIGT